MQNADFRYAPPPPYSNAYLLTAALYNPLTGEFSPQTVGSFDDRNRAKSPRMKRVVAIAQKEMGVLHTGSHFGASLGTAFSNPYLTRGTRSTFWDDSHAPANLNGTYVGQYNDAAISFLGPVYDEQNITISIAEPPL